MWTFLVLTHPVAEIYDYVLLLKLQLSTVENPIRFLLIPLM